jgi:co-chaperonin GroES (HSP10)
MLRAIGKNILVKVKPKEQKKGVLILDNSNEPFEALVINVGKNCEVDVNVDDVLLLVPYCGSKISTEDDGYLLVTERDILGVVVV